MTTDAIGNQVVIGNHYGYAQSHNGLTRVKLGIAMAAADGRVSLEITSANYCGSNSESRVNDNFRKRKVSIRGIMLFPLADKLRAIDILESEAVLIPIEMRRNMRNIGEDLVNIQLPPALKWL